MAVNGISAETESQLQGFVDARQRPAVFLFHSDSLFRKHVTLLYDELVGREFEELDLVIDSGGGSIHAAYQIAELLRLHAKHVNACVPFWAKSAATLLCVGADKIVLGERAELGPLDVQMYEERKAGKGERTSALNPFKTLEQLQNFSVEALASAMGFIVDGYEMSYDDALRHAVAFVEATTGPLIGRLDPEKLGAYNRELTVAVEYGRRLLRRHGGCSALEAKQLAERLVYGYPSHAFIIDYKELKELGMEVEMFADAESDAVKQLWEPAESRELIVGVIEPTSPPVADDGQPEGAKDAVAAVSPAPEAGNGDKEAAR